MSYFNHKYVLKKIELLNKLDFDEDYILNKCKLNKVCIFIKPIPEFQWYNSGGYIVLFKFIDELNKAGINTFLFSLNLNIELNPKYNTPLTNTIDEHTLVIYPEIVFGNPLEALHVCRIILFYPLKRGGYELLNSWKKTDVICAFGNNDWGQKCDISMYVADFNLSKFIIKNIPKKKKYYFIYKALNFNWTDESLNEEINKLKEIGFEELKYENIKDHNILNKKLSNCSVFVSFDLHTHISNIAVLCGCLSLILKSELNEMSYEDLINRRGFKGIYNAVKPFDLNLLNEEYKFELRKKESDLYKKSTLKANNIEEFKTYFNLT